MTKKLKNKRQNSVLPAVVYQTYANPRAKQSSQSTLLNYRYIPEMFLIDNASFGLAHVSFTVPMEKKIDNLVVAPVPDYL